MRLCTELGFEAMTVDQIAAEAAVSRRTFFRYFPSKGAAIWAPFERELDAARAALEAAPADQPLLSVMRAATGASRFRAEEVEKWRALWELRTSNTTLHANSSLRVHAWEEAIAQFVARSSGQRPTDLGPTAVARVVVMIWRFAFDEWLRRGDTDLMCCIDEALEALSTAMINLD